jgi:hypothetical protein
MTGEQGSGSWLVLGTSPIAGEWIHSWGYGDVLAVGLEPTAEKWLVADAIRRKGRRPLMCVVEGRVPASLDTPDILHCDLTATCRSEHAHVGIPATSTDLKTAINIGMALLDPYLPEHHPSSTSRPDGGIDFAAFVNPALWTTLPLLAATLWVAGCESRGPREAMDWLANGHLRQIWDNAWGRAVAVGKAHIPLFEQLRDLLRSSPAEIEAACALSWQAIAPAEEAERLAYNAGMQLGPLDIRAWEWGGAVLVVTLPDRPSRGQGTIPKAIGRQLEDGGGVPGSPRMVAVWFRPSDSPQIDSLQANNLVVCDEPLGLDDSDAAWLIGADALRSAPNLAAVRSRAGSSPAVGHGRMYLVPDNWIKVGDQPARESLEVAITVVR